MNQLMGTSGADERRQYTPGHQGDVPWRGVVSSLGLPLGLILIGLFWMVDLNMLVITGGQEGTQSQFEALLRAGGFRLVELRDIPAVSSVLIAEHV